MYLYVYQAVAAWLSSGRGQQYVLTDSVNNYLRQSYRVSLKGVVGFLQMHLMFPLLADIQQVLSWFDHVWISSLGKGSLPSLIGTTQAIRGY